MALRNRGIFCICVFYAVYGPATIMLPEEPPTVAGVTVYRWLYVFLALALLIALYRSGSVRKFREAVPIPYFLIFICLLGSSIVSPYVVLYPLDNPQSCFNRILVYSLLGFTALQVWDDFDLKIFLWTVIGVSLTISVYVIQTAQTFRFEADRGGLAVNQNYVSNFIGIGVLATLYLAMHGKRLGLLWGLLIPLQAFALNLLSSRGATTACLAAIVAMVLLDKRVSVTKRASAFAIFAIAVAAIILFAPAGARLLERFAQDDTRTLDSRTVVWSAITHDMGNDVAHFVFGEGFLASKEYVNRRSSLVGNTHSVFLEWLLELGVVGLGLFLWLLLLTLKRVRAADTPYTALFLGWISYLCFYGLTGTITDDHLFWIISGVILGACSIQRKTPVASPLTMSREPAFGNAALRPREVMSLSNVRLQERSSAHL